MGIFTSKYKEDAMKWRNQEADKEKKDLEKTYKMVIEINLKDGDTQYATFTRSGRMSDVGFISCEWIVQRGDSRLNMLYEELKEKAGKIGIEGDNGYFYPHSAIACIMKSSIDVVTE